MDKKHSNVIMCIVAQGEIIMGFIRSLLAAAIALAASTHRSSAMDIQATQATVFAPSLEARKRSRKGANMQFVRASRKHKAKMRAKKRLK